MSDQLGYLWGEELRQLARNELANTWKAQHLYEKATTTGTELAFRYILKELCWSSRSIDDAVRRVYEKQQALFNAHAREEQGKGRARAEMDKGEEDVPFSEPVAASTGPMSFAGQHGGVYFQRQDAETYAEAVLLLAGTLFLEGAATEMDKEPLRNLLSLVRVLRSADPRGAREGLQQLRAYPDCLLSKEKK